MYADDTTAAGPVADFVTVGVPIIPEVAIPGKELVFSVEIDLIHVSGAIQGALTSVGAGQAFGASTVLGVGEAIELAPPAESTGFLFPTSGTNVNDGGSLAWSNPGNILASDQARATCNRSAPSASQLLYASGFDFSVIPDAALITGVDVRVERSYSSSGTGSIRDFIIQLTKNGTAPVGTNKAATGSDWVKSETDEVRNYTFSNAEAGNPTAAEVKASSFGVFVKANFISMTTGVTARVDAVSVQVHYGGGGPSEGAGAAAGLATVLGVGVGISTEGVGMAAGQATVLGAGDSTGGVGGSGFTSGFSSGFG